MKSRGDHLKSFFITLALLFVAVLSSSAVTVTRATAPAKKQKSVVQFNEPVTLQGVTLKGQYIFVHDDAAMARGEACTFVYKGEAEIVSKLVVSFHCVPAQRQKVDSFIVRTELIGGITQLKEYQFSGDAEAHMVPLTK